MFKFAVAALLIVGAAAAPIHMVGEINHPSTINRLNSVNDTWVAGENEIFKGKSFSEVKKFLGTMLYPVVPEEHSTIPASVQKQHDAISDVPASFDSRTQWGDFVHPIRNQLQCGSCWAFSASEVLSDRFSIQSNKTTPVLSAEDLVSCDTGDMGCNGGMLPNAWQYLQNTGLVADSCFPYTAGQGVAAACPNNKCPGTGSWTKSKAKSSYSLTTVEAMQKDIMTNGPIQVAFMVYKSFMSYKSGVYKKKWYELSPEGGHAVKIVGWGTDPTGGDYWTVANSWGTTWGMNGFFNIARGKDECKIESAGPPYAGLADV